MGAQYCVNRMEKYLSREIRTWFVTIVLIAILIKVTFYPGEIVQLGLLEFGLALVLVTGLIILTDRKPNGLVQIAEALGRLRRPSDEDQEPKELSRPVRICRIPRQSSKPMIDLTPSHRSTETWRE